MSPKIFEFLNLKFQVLTYLAVIIYILRLSDDLPLFVFIPNDSYLEKVSMTWSDFDHKIKE